MPELTGLCLGLVAGFLASRVGLFLVVQDARRALMAKLADVQAAVAALDASVKAAADRVVAAVEASKAGISEAEADQVVADLAAVQVQVDAIAAG